MRSLNSSASEQAPCFRHLGDYTNDWAVPVTVSGVLFGDVNLMAKLEVSQVLVSMCDSPAESVLLRVHTRFSLSRFELHCGIIKIPNSLILFSVQGSSNLYRIRNANCSDAQSCAVPVPCMCVFSRKEMWSLNSSALEQAPCFRRRGDYTNDCAVPVTVSGVQCGDMNLMVKLEGNRQVLVSMCDSPAESVLYVIGFRDWTSGVVNY